MANKANKDITGEAALSAVEDALSVDFTDEINNIDNIEAKIDNVASEIKNGSRSETYSSSDTNIIPRSLENFDDLDADEPIAPSKAANDEINPQLASLIYAIQQKPSSRIFLITFLISLIWIAACTYYGYLNVYPNLTAPLTTSSVFETPGLMSLLAIAFLPLLPIWGFALMLHRAQEMRHAASSMTEAAIQLLQPETGAENSVATVGRAIRREVSAIGNGVERAIARAGELEFMVQKEVMNLERSYGDSEERLRRLVNEIGTERDTMVTHADQLKMAIANTHSNLTTDIQAVSGQIEEKLRSATMHMSDTLSLRSETITTNLTQTSEGLINLLATTGENLDHKLALAKAELAAEFDESTATLTETIATNGKAVARLIETRTAGLQQATSLIDEKLEAGKAEFQASFSQKTEDLSSIMQAAGQSVNSLLKSTSSEIAEQSNQTIQKIEEGRTEFRKEMSEQTVEFSNMIASGKNEVAATISKASASVFDELNASADEFEKKGDMIAQQVIDNLSIRATEFANRVSEAGETIESSLEGKLNAIENSITVRGNNLANSLGTQTEALDKVLQERTETIENSISLNAKNLTSSLGMQTEALDKVLQERTNAIGQTIGEKLSGFGQQLTRQVDETVGKLQDQTTQLQTNTKSVEEIITSKTKLVEDAVKASTINFAKVSEDNLNATNAKAEEINALLTQTSADLSGSLDKATTNLTSKLGSTTKTLTDALDTTTSELSEKVSRSTDELNTAIQENKDIFSKTIEEKQSDFVSAIETQKDSLSRTLDGSTEVFNRAIEERANNLSSKLSQGAHQIASSLDEKSKAAADRMDSSVSELSQRLAENSNAIETQFALGNQTLEEKMQTGREQLVSSISDTVTQVGNEIDGKAAKISDLLTERAKEINNRLGTTLVETQRNLEIKTEELNTLLSSRTSDLAGLIDSEAKPAINSIIEAGTQTSAKLNNLSQMIREEANTLFSNIGSSSGLLEELIRNASNNLDMMQNSLSTQIESFSNAVETSKHGVEQSEFIASKLNESMQNTSNDMMMGIGGIAQRFEAQSVILQDATKMIDAAQANLEATLEGKQDALQQLAVGLVSHSDQINTNMTSFNHMITSMIEDANAKSRDVSGTISSEIAKAIEDATSRFDDAVNAMRSSASTMRQELEQTREQMRRGILELPDETEKNATAMRRVVTDQITALRDLSSIIEKSGKVFDASPAMSNNVRQPAAPAPASAPVAAPAAPARPTPSVSQALRTPTSRPQSATRSNPQPVPSSQPTPKSSGWVSDLLRRASEDERPSAPSINVADSRSPNQVVESLNSLSIDIANAIDHEASVELWERYQRGETNVFTRRLYTLQGQQTFDEIRSKYSRNLEFKNAVDRYITDFEQLLGKETNNGQNQSLAQSYLTSETGKVYTMLAHAAGKLD